MNVKSNFGLGLVTGVVLSLGAILFMAAKSDSNALDDQQQQTDELSGDFISVEAADNLISSYDRDWVKAKGLPENTTIGGYIGRANLDYITSQQNGEDYIKFRFYYTQGADDAPQIGLIFYPSETATAVLRTGSGSFCPTVCSQ